MPATPTGRVEGRPPDRYATERVCGTCGCIVAVDNVAKHIAWHAQAAATAFPATVVNGVKSELGSA